MSCVQRNKVQSCEAGNAVGLLGGFGTGSGNGEGGSAVGGPGKKDGEVMKVASSN